jgi:hypothetical protein
MRFKITTKNSTSTVSDISEEFRVAELYFYTVFMSLSCFDYKNGCFCGFSFDSHSHTLCLMSRLFEWCNKQTISKMTILSRLFAFRERISNICNSSCHMEGPVQIMNSISRYC